MKLKFLTGATATELESVPMSPGTLYFTADREIYFDTASNKRLRMDNSMDASIQKAIDRVNISIDTLKDLLATNTLDISKIQTNLKQHDSYFDTYVLNVSYDNISFDTTQIIYNNMIATAILDQAILDQCTLE